MSGCGQAEQNAIDYFKLVFEVTCEHHLFTLNNDVVVVINHLSSLQYLLLKPTPNTVMSLCTVLGEC